jgi:hypothetical protein
MLTKLTTIELQHNNLRGPLDAIEKLTAFTFLDLSADQYMDVGVGAQSNRFTGSIPSTIGMLTGLRRLALGNNQLTGPVPKELVQLNQLNYIELSGNPQLTGLLPAFDFANITGCCRMDEDVFTCPLPSGADKCVGGALCGGAKIYPAPTCCALPAKGLNTSNFR